MAKPEMTNMIKVCIYCECGMIGKKEDRRQQGRIEELKEAIGLPVR
jgi:hypothetical protein